MRSALFGSPIGRGIGRLKPEPSENLRFRIDLPAIFLYDRIERDCIIENASALDLSLASEFKPELFANVVVYSELLGRLEGRVVRTYDSNFVLEIQTTQGKREKLADLLKWTATQIAAGRNFHRVHERIVPKQPQSSLRLRDDQVVPCTLRDISRAGAGVISSVVPEVNTLVTIGSQRARVVRQIPSGFAVEFLRLVPVDAFDENFVP